MLLVCGGRPIATLGGHLPLDRPLDVAGAALMPATHDARPIGVFDSGLGGLTAVRELFRMLPHESVVYFGDTARLPYGSKSRETVTRFSLEIAVVPGAAERRSASLVACNTASSSRARCARAAARASRWSA